MNGFFAATSGFPGIYSGLRQKACSRAKPPLVKCLADLRIYKSIPVLRSESQFGAELNGSRPADLVERIQSAESPAEHLCGLSEQRIRNSRIRACEVWVVQNVEGLKQTPLCRFSTLFRTTCVLRYGRVNTMQPPYQQSENKSAPGGDPGLAIQRTRLLFRPRPTRRSATCFPQEASVGRGMRAPGRRRSREKTPSRSKISNTIISLSTTLRVWPQDLRNAQNTSRTAG